LETLLAVMPGIALMESCGNAIHAIRAIKSHRPDVLFVDIQLPKINGLKLISMIDDNIMPCVVFITAYDDFAVQAFENNAIDYLVKPVQPERLARAIAKVNRFLGEGHHARYDTPTIDRIPCIGAHSIKLIDTADVEFVHSSMAGVAIVTSKGEFYTDLTLGVLETKTKDLVRCQKQYLVNIRQIDEILRDESHNTLVKTRSHRLVPVSRRYLGHLMELLGIKLPENRNPQC
jgi:two-component system LytT family response regulator